MHPTRAQVDATRAVVRWYLATHYRRPGDVGLIDTFTDRERVGEFAVSKVEIERGNAEHLFRLFVTVAMFQRLRDTHVMGILKRVTPSDARELTTVRALATLARDATCDHARTPEELSTSCSLAKDPATKRGVCSVAEAGGCFLHRHTELLRRYGHFGKMPTSAALVIERWGGDLNELRRRVFAEVSEPLARAQRLEAVLSATWRVSDKIASMYLSLLTVPDLGLAPPWRTGIDASWFVVVDQNVDAFLASIGYAGGTAYLRRREFVRAVAGRIDLGELDARLERHNPRLVQQAMYLFMSRANRARAADDCSRVGKSACVACPRTLAVRCPSNCLDGS